jgi:phosphoenolpyruvate carboxylase
MDGHPHVTAKSIRATLARQRALALDLYYNECREVGRHLSQSESRVSVAEEILARIKLYEGHFQKAAHSIPMRHRNMPYRVFLRLISARLQATYDDAAFPYESPEEFIADIELIAGSLRAHHGHHAGLFSVKRLLRRAQTFGFHLATLDIRQHALVHRRVVGEALLEPDWLELSSEQRTARLKEALERRESPLGELSSEGRRTLAVFQTIAHCRRKYGRASIGPYIVSMAHGPDDVLSVLLLARWGHLGPKGADVPIDVAPLFETAEDLQNAADIMRRLLNDERYRKHLSARGDQQMVMIGYADSNQDGGMVSACWTLQTAQRELVEVLAEFGVSLTLFHGRGGTISRGGGRVHDAVLAAPYGAVSGRLRMTEQGESINAKYGLRGIAMRSLEQTLSSVLWVTANPPRPSAPEQDWQAAMAEIASQSREAYKSLVEDSPDFDRYFRLATPIDVIERMNEEEDAERDIEATALAQLAANRWEFAWTQNRCLLPAWFGFASGVEKRIERSGSDAVRDMFAQWPFARVLLSEIETALAKSDLDIAERYSELAGELHARYFPLIRAEYDRSVALVLALTGQAKLLENSDTLRRAIRLRNPYVDPMSLLQINLLERWRRSDGQDGEVFNALIASVNGIANGMQNTG